MVYVTREQQSCPPRSAFGGGSQLPMGNDDNDASSSQYGRSKSLPFLASSSPSLSSSSSSFFLNHHGKSSSSSSASSNAGSANFSLSRWMVPIAYGFAVLSCYSAFRTNKILQSTSIGLNEELEALVFQKEETLKILKDARETKDKFGRQRKKLRRTQRLFGHEDRMKEEIFELKRSPDYQETMKQQKGQQSGVAMTWVQQRQEALYHKIYSLQAFIQEQSRKQVLTKYGPGPHRVQFNVMSHNGKKPGNFVVELAPIGLVPHAIQAFLDMVSSGLWDNTVFFHHESQNHVIASAPVNYGTFETKHYHFDALGYTGVSYPEYSEEFGHDKYTIGFSGTGPNFYINTMDNTRHHGPGGQGHHELPSDADPCFGRIILGTDVVREMMPGTHSSGSDPVSWHDFDLTQIVTIRLLE